MDHAAQRCVDPGRARCLSFPHVRAHGSLVPCICSSSTYDRDHFFQSVNVLAISLSIVARELDRELALRRVLQAPISIERYRGLALELAIDPSTANSFERKADESEGETCTGTRPQRGENKTRESALKAT